MNLEEKKALRRTRVENAIKIEKTDQTPVFLLGAVALARCADPRIVPGDFYTRPEEMVDAVIAGVDAVGGADVFSTEYPPMMSGVGIAELEMPGRDLPMNSYWQMDERGIITLEDYDFIIENGWDAFFGMICTTRFKHNVFEQFGKMAELLAMQAKRLENTEYPNIHAIPAPGTLPSPFNMLSGGRKFVNFTRDMFKIPDKLEKVINIITDSVIESTKPVLASTDRPLFFNTFMVRSGADMLSLPKFERFAWKTMLQYADLVTSAGSYLEFHIDGDYLMNMDHILQLPHKKCILFCDGMMDKEKVAEKIAGKICFAGDVPPAMMTLGTPDDVYTYCKNLQKLFGYGLMLGPGCCMPPDSKPENIKAIIAAAKEGC